MILALALLLLTLASLVALGFVAVFVVWPLLLRCADLALKLWRWVGRVIFVVRAMIGDVDGEDYGDLK